jgi:hypothetical protein
MAASDHEIPVTISQFECGQTYRQKDKGTKRWLKTEGQKDSTIDKEKTEK